MPSRGSSKSLGWLVGKTNPNPLTATKWAALGLGVCPWPLVPLFSLVGELLSSHLQPWMVPLESSHVGYIAQLPSDVVPSCRCHISHVEIVCVHVPLHICSCVCQFYDHQGRFSAPVGYKGGGEMELNVLPMRSNYRPTWSTGPVDMTGVHW